MPLARRARVCVWLINAQLPNTVTQIRGAAHLGLAMDNLESEWNFSELTLALARTPGYFALSVRAVDLKNAPQTAETLDKIKQCLAASQIEVEVENIKVKPLREGSTSTLQDVFIVARLLPKASKMIQLLCSGPPGAYRQLFDLPEIGGIPSKGDYPPRSKLAKLPFDGAKFGTVALVRSVMCVTETHGAERAAYMMDQVLLPALTARLDAEADEKRRILAGHEAKSLDAAEDLVTRQRANDTMASMTPYLAALAAVRLKLPDCFQIFLIEPLAKHTHDALDSTLAYSTRDYNDQSAMRMRGQVCNGFRSGSSLMYIVKRTHFNPSEARVISFLSSQLLSMTLPEQFLKLSPVFVLSVPKLAAATSDPDSIAGKFATAELMKTKVHLLAGESILNTDGENRHFGYDQLAVANITTESTDVYSIVHPLGSDEATKHRWIRGFHEAAALAGQAVSVEYTSEEFFIREIDTVEVGAASSVWDIDDCLCTANESIKHTNLKVEPWLLQTTQRHNDRSGPTPASLAKLAEVHNLMPLIKQWSKLNAPNDVWKAAAASMGVDVDADSGSGRGGGAIEERFKALEDAHSELKKEMSGVKSTVGDLATTVNDIGTNVNAGFAQIMQSLGGFQQGQAALLNRIQGTDASVAMIGHAVAGIPGTTFAMPEPTAAAVTGYGGAGGAIASAAAADAVNGAPMALETVSETALVTVAPTIDPRLAGAPFSATTTTTGSGVGNGAPSCPELSDGLDDAEPTPCTANETRLARLSRLMRRTLTTSPRHVPSGKAVTQKSSDCVPSAPSLSFGAGAPMAPEHSDGLDDYDVPSRTAAAGEEFAVTMRRIIAYGGTNSASTPDGSMQRLGTVTTLAGRRSARLTSLAATGGGIAAEDPETQAILLHSLQVEQEVKARLRAELPPRDDDWSESGGDVLPGAQFEVDVRSEDMTVPTQDDGEVFLDDENDPESFLTYSVPTVTTTTTVQDADPPTDGGALADIPSGEPDDGVVPEGPPLGDRTDDDSGVVGVTQGTAEGALTHEALRSTDDGARRFFARLMAVPGLLTVCANHERCGRTQAATVSNPGYCCDECECTNGREHAENCCVDQTTDSQASEHVFGSAEMEATLNDTKPAAMDF